VVATVPDSLRSLPDFRGYVEFHFDRVVSEGQQPNFGQGTGTLEQLVLLSPSRGVPVVRWRRDRILVRPREGWRPNTTYRIELLPGVRDLRNNATTTPAVITFTTGGELPGDTLVGRVVDWTARRPVPRAAVLAVLLPDSLVYRSTADSTGRFRLGPLPRGEYLVYGLVDQNRNYRLDSREPFDTVRVTAGRDSVGEIWAFPHDTLPPRIQSVTRLDSLSVAVAFTLMLDPSQRLPADSVQVLRLPDSVAVPVVSILPQALHDSVYRAPPAQPADVPDTVAVGDTAARPAPPPPPPPPPPPTRQVIGARPSPAARDTVEQLTTRPALFDRLVVRVEQPLADGERYLVRMHGVRSVSGVSGTVQAPLVIPDPAAARRP
jgi:hypothetical protein